MLYPNKNGTVSDLLEEAKKHLCESVYGSPVLSPEGSGKLRLLEISSNRIIQIQKDDVLVECLNPTANKSYRIEEIPKDELNLEPSEFLMPVAHFHKETIHTFGTPFLLKLRQKEMLSQIKARIQKKLDVSDKEFEKVSERLFLLGKCSTRKLLLAMRVYLHVSLIHPARLPHQQYKFALVIASRAQYFSDQSDYPINKDEFQMHVAPSKQRSSFSSLFIR